jgi:ankyrin repeat protein
MSELLDAIEHLDEERVRWLLKSGSDPNVRGYGGVTPLHLAVDSEAEEALYRYDTEGDMIPPDGRFVWLLVAHGADVEAKDDKGETPLDWARHRNHTAAIEAMVRESAT